MVQDDISSLNLHLVQETSSSVARHRIGAPLPSDCKTVKIFSNPNGRMMKLVNELVHQQGYYLKDDTDDNDGDSSGFHSLKLASCDIVPVEIRVYQQKGAGMELHHDDVLFSPEQIEVVFTLENSSDCITKWEELEIEKEEEEEGGGHVKTKTSWKHVETEANSAIILRAGPKGARHSVSSLKYGKRVIIKLVFVEQDAVFLEKAGGSSSGRKTGRVISSQFAGGGNKNSKKKKKKKQKENNRSK